VVRARVETVTRALIRRIDGVIRRPLPVPPSRWRRGPLRAGAFTSALRSERLTSQLGLWLGIAFGICFVTGFLSHAIQHPPSWFAWPARPVGLYRLTQGVHVATGLATVPLLAAKLWSVYPKLFAWPPVRDLAHALERASVAVLVGAALFQVVSGVLNVARWYAPMPFFFTAAHYWTAWLAIGALLLHVAVQLPVIRRGLSGRGAASGADARAQAGLSRRGLLAAVAVAAGTVTLATVGQTVRPLARLSPLAPRRPDLGPQRLPVNQSAIGAGVVAAATDPAPERCGCPWPTSRRCRSTRCRCRSPASKDGAPTRSGPAYVSGTCSPWSAAPLTGRRWSSRCRPAAGTAPRCWTRRTCTTR